jgi:signal peptidase II
VAGDLQTLREGDARMSRLRPHKFVAMLLIAAFVVGIDQWTKGWISSHFGLYESRPFGHFFSLTYLHNTGTAFGLLQGNNKFLLWVAVGILSVLLYSARGLCERAGGWGFLGTALVLGGAIGNIIDRLRFGNVIDFLDFHFWPVFNMADSCISIGAFLLMVGLLLRDSSGPERGEAKRAH